ncbi:hypothetical protein HK102_008277, partial [Quaeritorhiza haematococci]
MCTRGNNPTQTPAHTTTTTTTTAAAAVVTMTKQWSKAMTAKATTTMQSTTTATHSVRAQVPRLEDYGIHPQHGFLAVDPPPLKRLPSYYEPWESLLDNLQALLLADRLRESVRKLPILDTSKLRTQRQWERAYVVLSFLGHSYVWGNTVDISDRVPATIAKPWVTVSARLGLKPVVSYSAVELFNYKLLDPHGPYDLSNLALLHTFTGSMDEAWFFLVSLAIEAAGGRALPALLDAMRAVTRDDLEDLRRHLQEVAGILPELTKILVRMYEKNDPHVFYHRVRPYVAGWENSLHLPDGLLYEGVTPSDVYTFTSLESPTVPHKSSSSPSHHQPHPQPARCSAKLPSRPKSYSEAIQSTSTSPPSTFSTTATSSTTAFFPTTISTPTPTPTVLRTDDDGCWLKFAGASGGQSSLIHCLDIAFGIDHLPT